MTVKELIHILGLLEDNQKEYVVITNNLLDKVSVATFEDGEGSGFALIQHNEEVECP